MLSDQSRLLALIIGCAVLWSVESIAPLYKYERHRLRRSIPNLGLTVLLLLTKLLLSFATAAAAAFVMSRKLGLLFLFSMPKWTLAVLGIIALDMFAYFAHVLMHKSWLGWQFHRVHHTDNQVNVTTAFRQHPGETAWRVLWYVLAIFMFGVPLWVLGLYLMISTLNAQLEHTNVKLSDFVDRILRFVFVTPNMHKVHHSRDQIETDSNYSNIFSLWDRIFGTYTPTIDFKALQYGLDGFDERETQTLSSLLKLPFTPTRNFPQVSRRKA